MIYSHEQSGKKIEYVMYRGIEGKTIVSPPNNPYGVQPDMYVVFVTEEESETLEFQEFLHRSAHRLSNPYLQDGVSVHLIQKANKQEWIEAIDQLYHRCIYDLQAQIAINTNLDNILNGSLWSIIKYKYFTKG